MGSVRKVSVPSAPGAVEKITTIVAAFLRAGDPERNIPAVTTNKTKRFSNTLVIKCMDIKVSRLNSAA